MEKPRKDTSARADGVGLETLLLYRYLPHVASVPRQLGSRRGGSKHPVRGNARMAGFKSGFQMLRAASGGLPNFVADLNIA